jgi:Carbohydrate-selective porin, OprB family/S-layer homology domain
MSWQIKTYSPIISSLILAIFNTANVVHGQTVSNPPEQIKSDEQPTEQPIVDSVDQFTKLFQPTDLRTLNKNISQNAKKPISENKNNPLPAKTEILTIDNDDLQEPINQAVGQVSDVFQLSDVQPTDWAYQALKNVIQKYGCLTGYSDATFKGNQPFSRYEFAASFNQCLDNLQKITQNAGGNLITKEDLQNITKLSEQFAPELQAINENLDKLDKKTAFLEGSHFSSTTQIFGQVIFGVQGKTDCTNYQNIFCLKVKNNQINVISNTQLTFFTQFNPGSILITGLQIGTGHTGTTLANDPTVLGYTGGKENENKVLLSDLTYRQLIGKDFAVIVGPKGVNPVNVFRGGNRVESAGFGPLSLFAQRNPIVNIGGDSGLGFDWQLGSNVSLQAVYSLLGSNDAILGGLFGGKDGKTSTGVQAIWSPSASLDLAFQYVNAYSTDGKLGTNVGDDILAVANNSQLRTPLKTDAFGATLEWRLNPKFTMGGWGGYTSSVVPGEMGTVETINWMAFLNFPDLFGQGNLGGFFIGQPPKISTSTLSNTRNVPNFLKTFDGQPGTSSDTTLHIEAFYRWRMTNNIVLTPGFVVILDPHNDSSNDTITIGVMRTTFSF